jgi:Phage integrase family
MTHKRISPHIFRHSFAIRYLVLGNDPFSLQELLGHEDMTTVKNYMHMNDETIQSQKRKYSPGDHLPTRIPGPRETRRRGYRTRGQSVKKREEWTTWSPCRVPLNKGATRQMLSSNQRSGKRGRTSSLRKKIRKSSQSGTASDQHSIQQGDEAGASTQLLLLAMSGRQRLSLLSPDFTPTMRKPWCDFTLILAIALTHIVAVAWGQKGHYIDVVIIIMEDILAAIQMCDP